MLEKKRNALYDKTHIMVKLQSVYIWANGQIGLGELPLNVPMLLSTARVLRFFFLRIPASLMSTGWLLAVTATHRRTQLAQKGAGITAFRTEPKLNLDHCTWGVRGRTAGRSRNITIWWSRVTGQLKKNRESYINLNQMSYNNDSIAPIKLRE